jgi:hypothetical protein
MCAFIALDDSSNGLISIKAKEGSRHDKKKRANFEPYAKEKGRPSSAKRESYAHSAKTLLQPTPCRVKY